MSIRVLIVDDHEVFRDGLRAVIESRPGQEVAGEASTVREALSLVDGSEYDLVLVDLAMPGSTGMSLVRELRRRKRREPVLVLTMHGDPDVAAEAFAAGATGFALKSDSRESLLDAVQSVARRERYLSSSMPRAAVDQFLQKRPRASDTVGPLSVLSPREREVFGLLVRGYSNEGVARELCISAKTVDTHRSNIFGRLRVHSLFDLLRFAVRHNLVDAGPPRDQES